jgi:hypothetical protein
MAAQTISHETLNKASPLDERLERGEVVSYPACPFPLPEADDRIFLFAQQQGHYHKNISFNPHSSRLSGHCHQSEQNTRRLLELLRTFGDQATQWLLGQLPRYGAALQRDRVSFRPEEEATRPLRLTARNDLLHVDAFPNRPSQGARILRLFVNIHTMDPRVWVTSDTFAQVFHRYGRAVGLPQGGRWNNLLRDGWRGLFDPRRPQRSDYDCFMLRLHNFLKSDEAFQERCRKRFWSFAPGTLWLAFTDGVTHAELRGRYALEHSYFVPRASLALPDLAPAAILERACQSKPLAA